MASKVPQTVTLAEFLEWDDGTDRRYQLVDGVPVMMAPTLEAHGELALNIGAEIRSRLQSPCRVIAEAGVTVPARRDTFYVADLAITCAPREPGRRMLAEPVVIVEVLSPSTGPVDRWRRSPTVGPCRRSRRSSWRSPRSAGSSCRDARPRAGASRT
jgi:Uma2 family endonuclease